MKRLFLPTAIWLVLFFSSVTTAQGQSIAELIDGLHDASTVSEYEYGYLIQSEDGAIEIYSRNADDLMIPASNTKIYTTAAAIGLLGESYTFETRIYYTGTRTGGTINGDLIILSEHDPTWQTSVYGSGNADRGLRHIAQRVRNEAGITSVTGFVRGYGAMVYNKSSINLGHQSLAASNIASLNDEAATEFRSELIAAGVSISNTSVTGHTGFTPPAGSTLLLTYQSNETNDAFSGRALTLREACFGLNKSSHNPMADFLLRHVGWKLNGTDSYTSGESEVVDWMQNTAGIDTSGINMSDGSGISSQNRFTPRQTVELLRYMQSVHPTWEATLPISGTDGTLGSRLGGILQGQIHAKTGTLPSTGVVTLSGYMDHPTSGLRYIFSMFVNTPGSDSGGQAINTTLGRGIIDDSLFVVGENLPEYAPDMLATITNNDSDIHIEWSHVGHHTNGYRIYRQIEDGVFSELTTILPTYIIESGNDDDFDGLNNSDYSESGPFQNSSAHSEAPGLTSGIGSRFILRTDGTGTATFTPSALPDGKYRVDVTCYEFSSADARNAQAIFHDANGTRSHFFELSEETAGDRWRSVGVIDFRSGENHRVEFSNSTQSNTTASDRLNADAVRFTPLSYVDTTVTIGERVSYYVVELGPDGAEGAASDIYTTRPSGSPSSLLIVDAFERWNRDDDYAPFEGNDYALVTAKSICGQSFDSVNSLWLQEQSQLNSYAALIWNAGEESTIDESFSPAEQVLVRNYRDNGGHLFVSGSEIGWDLDKDSGPTASDRAFYNEVLKAALNGNGNDDALTYQAAPVGGQIFDGIPAFSFDNGTNGTYDVDYPDVLTLQPGAVSVLSYSGGTGGTAALLDDGTNGQGKLVYLAFPFETILDGATRDEIMCRSLDYFDIPGSDLTNITGWFIY